jgi:hypothetical protein
MVDPVVAIKTLLLQEAMPDLSLRPGSSVVARVASRGLQHGVLVLAGVPLTALLPDEVKAGSTLRLKVAEVTPERVTLQIESPPSPPLPPGQLEAPPRGDARVHVEEGPQRRREGGQDVAGVTLAFESEALGRLDLRIELRADRVDVTVDVAVAAHDAVAGAAGRLRDGLTVRTEREAAVHVRPRREPVDLYA